MARVVVTDAAAEDLRDLDPQRPAARNTHERLRRSPRPLADFPELGAKVGAALADRRFLLGPWR